MANREQIERKIKILEECIEDAHRYIRDNINNITRNGSDALIYLPEAYQNIQGYQEQIIKYDFAIMVLNELLENK